MKKSILIIGFALMGNLVNAQGLKLLQLTDSLPVASNYTFTVGANDPTFVFELIVKNISGSAIATKVRKTIIMSDVSQTLTFCYGMICYPPTTMVTPSSVSIGAGLQLPNGAGSYGIRTDFDNGGFIGTAIVNYRVYDSANISDSASVTITYNVIANGINSYANKILVSAATPNPASATINFSYNLNGSANDGVIKIFNALGGIVKTVPLTINKTNLQVDVSDLEEGFYFYTLIANGRNSVTRKFVVSR